MEYIKKCCAHHKYEGKLALVLSQSDNNIRPDLYRITDPSIFDHHASRGYPVKCAARCITPVNCGTAICRVVDCDHSTDCPELILEPILHMDGFTAVSPQILHFFNESEEFADGDCFGLYNYRKILNYGLLFRRMQQYDLSIDTEASRSWEVGKEVRKVLNLMLRGVVSVDDIYGCLTLVEASFDAESC